ncbi:pyridoxamine 5'-phosphate oxidase family protein [Nocardiopsis kunsanensis]|uniref:Pyridoxamine 5'-phosphate oxidase N-terminal domain-containing protein n=1 Tax=Nocardiopsis kunsanensis TaxID=141693 RepID=A0A918XE81_9ACTN|nr:pyridoxamine 5'-phosphate oxidase family protein [Nocardiopsis kunsanensis]GHD28123.1 hypothetical protein GCM10007147_27810 [Nocardiopsis kunsanensis]
MTTHSDFPETALCPEFSTPGAGPVPWDRARAVVTEAPLCRVTTVRPDGRPHMAPLLGVWVDGAAHFCTGEHERKALNLASDPHCLFSAGTDRLYGPPEVVVEGRAVPLEESGDLDRVARAYEDKYGEEVTSSEGTWFGLCEGIRAARVLVLRVEAERALAFGKAPGFSQTRYVFT